MNIRHLFRAGMLLGMLALSPAKADVLVLVHGWSANADTWLHSGVLANLATRGWVDAGVVVAGPQGTRYLPTYGSNTHRKVYRAQLTAEAPLLLQARQLQAELQMIRQRHPNERITLAGHSAGGIVARLTLVHPQTPPMQVLITLGSPNQGTIRAIQGLDIVESKPFFCPGPGIDLLKRVAGGDDYRYLRASRGALYDLQPVSYGSLIDWLNHQPHPNITYYSVIRGGPVGDGDELVPALSQDLNQVPMLRGRVHVLVAPTGHRLEPRDGILLADILERTN